MPKKKEQSKKQKNKAWKARTFISVWPLEPLAVLYVLVNLLNDVTLSKLNSLSGDIGLWTVIFKTYLLRAFLQHIISANRKIKLFLF
jgi:hypothetical protein